LVLFLLCVVAAQAGLPGELVVVIASKGQFKGEPDFQGMDALAESAHRNGHPVTWFLKPATVGPATERLKRGTVSTVTSWPGLPSMRSRVRARSTRS
jgi:hypothetical protein